ncbi:isocitrate lyase [Wickerhamomyces ciferrii]|uniref:Isocitrate lyase n=1 Tax=Wickerhamomyces ciferrii (strain ATCC 14091 / BCRC 22168 / CBS 111 / JCM 3599 / NBRC 0793 / NRRL Y-1031 F-60-10) TaxID=1206466 RepID=K0KE49_WICCF|nr:isocitrate lyase [Wickerhamomyces ciferrii]CCH43375.1 isocitrate lyase [Wickerhamomyces ciferrii]
MLGKRFQSTISRFPYPSKSQQYRYYESQVEQITKWWESSRFKGIKRTYPAELVASHRGSFNIQYPSSIQATKLFNLLNERFLERKPVHTIGSIDPVQISQSAKNQEIAYVSGWACSSVLTTTNEVSPDFGDYPYDTVPNQVERLFKAQQLHDRKATSEWIQNPQRDQIDKIDYLRPIIADADTGHGGTGAVMKLAKLFAESGAAGIHIEDQLHGGKKCGHLAGKVIVPTSTHITRLIATRLQWDIMNTENLVIARTDSETGNLLSSAVDPRDHEFILGVIEDVKPLSEVLYEAESQGADSSKLNEIEQSWLEQNKLYTVSEAAELKLKELGKSIETFNEFQAQSKGKSLYDTKQIFKELTSHDLKHDIEAPKTREGYYPVKNGIDVAVKRSIEYAPYADLLWLETKTPNLKYAQDFAERIHKIHPDKKLVYNLSPSFNWSAHGFSEQDLQNFIWDLAKAGFVLQLVSLAGLHTNAVSNFELSEAFKDQGMKAYVELVQKKEKEIGCDVLTHQKWSGANYYDELISAVQSGSSQTSSVGKDSTEHSF